MSAFSYNIGNLIKYIHRGGIEMILQHLFCQIYLSGFVQNNCTPSNYGELSEYTISVYTGVNNLTL